MVTVKLYGHLGRLFGKSHTLAISSPIEAVRALQANFPEFRKQLQNQSILGYKLIIDNKDRSGNEYLKYTVNKELKIIPILKGAGGNNQGWVQIVIAIIIVLVAWYAPTLGLNLTSSQTTSMYMMAASMALNGVAALLYRPPDMNGISNATSAEENKGYHFDGPMNLSRAGSPVPLAYGRILAGSIIIHAGITTTQG